MEEIAFTSAVRPLRSAVGRAEKLPVHRHNHARGQYGLRAPEKNSKYGRVLSGRGELTSVPSRQKQEALAPQTVSASRARRVSQNQSAGESFSELHSTWSAADLPTIARQMALFS